MDQAKHAALTEVAVVLDRSGSMMGIKDDMEGGLWSFILEQHGQPGRCRVSLYRFDHEFEVAFEGRPSGEVKPEDCRLVPRGNTALNDAVVKALAAAEARILSEPEPDRPGLVVVLVITDGQENASTESRAADARKAIDRATEKLGWQFAFLAADAAGFQEGSAMSARQGTVGVYDRKDASEVFARSSYAVSALRSGHSKAIDISAPIKRDDVT